jgi:hypothetical protein
MDKEREREGEVEGGGGRRPCHRWPVGKAVQGTRGGGQNGK